jgi:hypothetical protein
MSVIAFPLKLLHERDHDWNITANTATSGQTATSTVDVRSDGGGLWVASLNNIQFRDRTDALLWRAIRQACNGGVSPIVVPRNDSVFAPFPSPPIKSYGSISFSDASFFSDGSGFYEAIIDVTCAAAALRATTLVLTLNNCAQLQGGEAFSILHPTMNWRLYEIATVTPIDATHSSVTFNPPLREAVIDGTQLEFDRPRCLMKLVDSKAMDLNVTTYPFTMASVKFIEAKYAS